MAPATQPSNKDKSTAPTAEAHDTPTTDAPAGDAPAAEAKPKQVKTAPPEGHVAPVQFAKEVDKHLSQPEGTTRPQVIYGYIRNSSDFPHVKRDAFPAVTVPLAEGLAWIDAKQTRKAERDAKKAAEAKAAADAAQAAPASDTPAPAES